MDAHPSKKELIATELANVVSQQNVSQKLILIGQETVIAKLQLLQFVELKEDQTFLDAVLMSSENATNVVHLQKFAILQKESASLEQNVTAELLQKLIVQKLLMITQEQAVSQNQLNLARQDVKLDVVAMHFLAEMLDTNVVKEK
jgi:hypothetical protein